jgi:hypothetical protein
MNPQLRERLGKVAFYAVGKGISEEYNWETAGEEVRECFRIEAEAIAMELAQTTLPVFQQMAFILTGKQVDMHFKENT